MHIKKSVKIGGHATSVSLEEEFWEELKAIAEKKKVCVSALIAEIDAGKKTGRSLSSSIRVYALEFLKHGKG